MRLVSFEKLTKRGRACPSFQGRGNGYIGSIPSIFDFSNGVDEPLQKCHKIIYGILLGVYIHREH